MNGVAIYHYTNFSRQEFSDGGLYLGRIMRFSVSTLTVSVWFHATPMPDSQTQMHDSTPDRIRLYPM